jgi:hypothetical protein
MDRNTRLPAEMLKKMNWYFMLTKHLLATLKRRPMTVGWLTPGHQRKSNLAKQG